MNYTIDPNSEEPIMLIDKHIGFDADEGPGIMGDLFQKELFMLDGMNKKRIQVWINSAGGVVQDGWNIYNAILRTKTKVDTYCVGMAASIAGVIFQAGRKRVMNDYGILMYHNPFGGDDKSLDAIRDSLITMISQRSSMNAFDVSKMMNRTTWIGADEAMTMGLCDEIDQSVEMNTKRSVGTHAEARLYWRETNKAINALLPGLRSNHMNVADNMKHIVALKMLKLRG
jgi:ATP-dependent Clp endopeptidase proteolytic subunit ClpP